MLFKFTDFYKKNRNINFPHRGIVVDNDDPKKLGRIKVKIPQLLEIDDNAKLPWIQPDNPYGLGGRVDTSEFSVPEINSEVTVHFPFEDIYFGYYKGYWQNTAHSHQILFDEDYPESYGKIDSNVSWWKVNKKKKYTEHFHVSKHTAIVDKEGNSQVYYPGTVDLTIDGDLNLKVGKNFRLNIKEDFMIAVAENMVTRVTGNWDLHTISNIFMQSIGRLDLNITEDVVFKFLSKLLIATGNNFNIVSANGFGVDSLSNFQNTWNAGWSAISSNMHHNAGIKAGDYTPLEAITLTNPSQQYDLTQADWKFREGSYGGFSNLADVNTMLDLHNSSQLELNHTKALQYDAEVQQTELQQKSSELMLKVIELQNQSAGITDLADSVRESLDKEAGELKGRTSDGAKKGGSWKDSGVTPIDNVNNFTEEPSYSDTASSITAITHEGSNIPIDDFKNTLNDMPTEDEINSSVQEVYDSSDKLANTDIPETEMTEVLDDMANADLDSLKDASGSVTDSIGEVKDTIDTIVDTVGEMKTLGNFSKDLGNNIANFSGGFSSASTMFGTLNKTFLGSDQGITNFIDYSDDLVGGFSNVSSGYSSFKDGFDISYLPNILHETGDLTSTLTGDKENFFSDLDDFSEGIFDGKIATLKSINDTDFSDIDSVDDAMDTAKNYSSYMDSGLGSRLTQVSDISNSTENIYSKTSSVSSSVKLSMAPYETSLADVSSFSANMSGIIKMLKDSAKLIYLLLPMVQQIATKLSDLSITSLTGHAENSKARMSTSSAEEMTLKINTLENAWTQLSIQMTQLENDINVLRATNESKISIISAIEDKYNTTVAELLSDFTQNYLSYKNSLLIVTQINVRLVATVTDLRSSIRESLYRKAVLKGLSDSLERKEKEIRKYT